MTNRFDAGGRRVRRAGVVLLSVIAACKPDEALSPAAPRRQTPSHASTDIVTSDFIRVKTNFAYLWANEPQAASYTPMPEYSYNASGGAMQVVRYSAGTYWVFIDSMFTTYDHRVGLSVVAYGPTTIGCSPRYPLQFLANFRLLIAVDCYDRVTRVRADSRFSVLVVGDGSVVGRTGFAYVEGDFGSSYSPDSATTFTTGPDPVVITWNGAVGSNDQNVNFGTGTTAGTTVLVTPQTVSTLLDPEHFRTPNCALGGWAGTSVDVHCFDGFGAAWVERFYVLQLERARPGRRFGFAYAHLASTGSYAPSAGHSYNSSGGAIAVTRTAVGRYMVEFTGLQKLAGHTENVQVTPFSGDIPSACNVVEWVTSGSGNSLLVFVECRRIPTGAYRDTKFNVVVIE